MQMRPLPGRTRLPSEHGTTAHPVPLSLLSPRTADLQLEFQTQLAQRQAGVLEQLITSKLPRGRFTWGVPRTPRLSSRALVTSSADPQFEIPLESDFLSFLPPT